jgi:F-type H+-transporting ATPase subunit gamma
LTPAHAKVACSKPAARAPEPSARGPTTCNALICNAALHAFAAENEARTAAMAAARRQIENELAEFRATERRVRQEAITAEIIELATGERASRAARGS